MSAPPYMQLYVADYLGDTRHLTTEQHGAYLLLLMTMWRAGGSLPSDPNKLARMTACTTSRWTRISPDVLAFFEDGGETISHKRLMLEFKNATEKRNQLAVIGSRGGKAKALKNKEPDLANASDMLAHTRASSTPALEPEKKKISEAKASSPHFDEFWLAYPNKVAKRKALAAYDKALKRIAGPDPPSQILAGVERAKTSRKWIDGYIEHPTTWLNGDCWEDQPAEVIPIQGRTHDRPHHDAKRTAKLENMERAFAGSYRAAGRQPEP